MSDMKMLCLVANELFGDNYAEELLVPIEILHVSGDGH